MYKNHRACAFLCAIVCALFCLPQLSAQASSSDASGTGAASLQSDQSALSFSQDQSTILLPQAPQAVETRSPSSVWLFFRMILVLALVVALIYVVLRFMRKTTTVADTDDPFLRRVASLSLGQGKSVQVVTLLDHAYLVGVSDSGIQPIGEIADKELVDSMNLFADKNSQTKKPRSFSDVLELFMPMSGKERNPAQSPVSERAESVSSYADAPLYAQSPFNPDESIEAAERRTHRKESASEEHESPASSISRLRSRLNSGFSEGDGDA